MSNIFSIIPSSLFWEEVVQSHLDIYDIRTLCLSYPKKMKQGMENFHGMNWQSDRPITISSPEQADCLIHMNLNPKRLILEKTAYQKFIDASKVFLLVKYLDISSTETKGEQYHDLLSKFPSVEDIVVNNVDNSCCESISHLCPHIRSFRSTSSTIVYLVDNLLRLWPKLEEIVVPHGIVEGNQDHVYPHMKSFALREYREIDNDDEFAMIIALFPNLEKLYILSNPMFDGVNDWKHLHPHNMNHQQMISWPHIHELHLDHASLSSISQLSQVFPYITALSIKRSRVSHDGAAAISTLFPSISSITIEGLEQGGDMMTKQLLRNCKKLRYMRMKCCTDLLLDSLIHHDTIPDIHEVVIDECTITNKPIDITHANIMPIPSLRKWSFVNVYCVSPAMIQNCAMIMSTFRSTMKLVHCINVHACHIQQLRLDYPHIQFIVESISHIQHS